MSSNSALHLSLRQCLVCHTRAGLERCGGGCGLAFYCGCEHQDSDRDRHELTCTIVSKAVADMGREGQGLLSLLLSTGTNYFLPGDTQTYLMAYRVGCNNNMSAHSNDVVTEEFSLDRLNREHYMVNDDFNYYASRTADEVLPTLWLRQGRDQECYVYLKLYVVGSGSPFGLTDQERQKLNVGQDADALEPSMGLFISRDMNPVDSQSRLVCVALIKVRVLIDLRQMQNVSRALQGTIPRELLDDIRSRSLVSSIVASRADIRFASVEKIAELIPLVKEQVRDLFNVIAKWCRAFWPMLVGYRGPGGIPDMYLHSLPRGGNDEAVLMIMYHYQAWRETPGSIEVIESLMKAA